MSVSPWSSCAEDWSHCAASVVPAFSPKYSASAIRRGLRDCQVPFVGSAVLIYRLALHANSPFRPPRSSRVSSQMALPPRWMNRRRLLPLTAWCVRALSDSRAWRRPWSRPRRAWRQRRCSRAWTASCRRRRSRVRRARVVFALCAAFRRARAGCDWWRAGHARRPRPHRRR